MTPSRGIPEGLGTSTVSVLVGELTPGCPCLGLQEMALKIGILISCGFSPGSGPYCGLDSTKQKLAFPGVPLRPGVTSLVVLHVILCPI